MIRPFLAEPTEDVLDRICDAAWNGEGQGVVFLDIQRHNACNHTLSGTIDVDGVVHAFIIDNGDRNGTVVRAWGDPEDVGVAAEPEPSEPLTFIPRSDFLFQENPAMFRLYIEWRKAPWFKEKERNYAYDRHFQPGVQIEKYYREFAESRGLKIGLLSSLHPDALEAIKKAGAL